VVMSSRCVVVGYTSAPSCNTSCRMCVCVCVYVVVMSSRCGVVGYSSAPSSKKEKISFQYVHIRSRSVIVRFTPRPPPVTPHVLCVCVTHIWAEYSVSHGLSTRYVISHVKSVLLSVQLRPTLQHG